LATELEVKRLQVLKELVPEPRAAQPVTPEPKQARIESGLPRSSSKINEF